MTARRMPESRPTALALIDTPAGRAVADGRLDEITEATVTIAFKDGRKRSYPLAAVVRLTIDGERWVDKY